MKSRQRQRIDEIEQARTQWELASKKRKDLENELQPGSGFGDPHAYEAYKHSVEAARYNEERCYKVYLDLKSANKEDGEVFELRPNFYGIGLNLKKLFRKIFSRH